MIEYICLTYFLFLTFLGMSILKKAANNTQNITQNIKDDNRETGIIRLYQPFMNLQKKAFDMITF